MSASVFNEHDNTRDTVTLEACTDTVLTVSLANSTESYDLTETHDLHLELQHHRSTLTLGFVYGASWPQAASATVMLGTGPAQTIPCSFADLPTSSTLHVTITIRTAGQAVITWDPKIKVIPPVRTGR